MSETNFDPYLDYDKITTDQAEKLHQLVKAQKTSTTRLLRSPSDTAVAAQSLKDVVALQEFSEELLSSIWTIPMMVHVAGEPSEESNPDDAMQTAKVQRCERCASILFVWYPGMMVLTPEGPGQLDEDEMTWWTQGARIAKATSGQASSMYVIEDRDLEKHEHPCVDLSSLA